MTTAGPSEDNNTPIVDGVEPLDSARVPDVTLDGAEMPPVSRPVSRSTQGLSDEELAAAKKAADELSIDDILAADGVNRISVHTTGQEVSRPIGLDPSTTLEDIGEALGNGVEAVGRGLGAAKEQVGSAIENLKQKREGQGEKDDAQGVEVMGDIVNPLLTATKGAGKYASGIVRGLFSGAAKRFSKGEDK